MSWSVSAIGKAQAVRQSIASQFENGGKCAEPEESIRLAAAQLIDASLAAQDGVSAVEISASGSQSFRNYTEKTGLSNSLTISIQPKWGFVE